MIPFILNYLLPTPFYYFSLLWLNPRPSLQTQLHLLKDLTVLSSFSILPFPIYSSFLDTWYICIFLWDISFSATWQSLPFQKCIPSSYRLWPPDQKRSLFHSGSWSHSEIAKFVPAKPIFPRGTKVFLLSSQLFCFFQEPNTFLHPNFSHLLLFVGLFPTQCKRCSASEREAKIGLLCFRTQGCFCIVFQLNMGYQLPATNNWRGGTQESPFFSYLFFIDINKTTRSHLFLCMVAQRTLLGSTVRRKLRHLLLLQLYCYPICFFKSTLFTFLNIHS